jgi:hypothetical protein
MAITSGAGPHSAWLNVKGSTFPITHGGVSQSAKRKSSGFNVTLPLSLSGLKDTMAAITADDQVSISTLTRGVTEQLIIGQIENIDFDHIARTAHVTGHDLSARLHYSKTSEKWLNKKPSDIVSDLIGRVGLKGNISASSLMAGKQLQQDYVKLSDNVSFSYIIHKMAEFDGARWFFDNNGQFHYVPLGNPTGVYSIFIDQTTQPISSDCLALKVKRNVQAGRPHQVSVKSWHPKKKQVFQYTANVAGSGTPILYNYHIPNLLQDHVKKHAQSQANEKTRHELTVSATIVGDPSVNASMGLSLSGTNYFDQTFDIDTVHHDFGMSGHLTHITARSAKKGRSAS